MPESEYFGGKGEKVMAAMKARYGAKKGKSVFYATANKRGQKPGGKGGRGKGKSKRRYGAGGARAQADALKD